MVLDDMDWTRLDDLESAPRREQMRVIARGTDRSCAEAILVDGGGNIWRRRYWNASRIAGPAGEVWFRLRTL